MKTVTTLSLLAIALAMAGCNEKVSPELENSSVTGGGGTVPVPPSEYYFRVVDSSAPVLNYKLHKTGEGNSAKACEVTNTSGLTSDAFRGAPSVYDISCFFEAEELSLLHQGFKFKVESSANTCDYVGYSPFSFYDKIPGDSSDSLIEVKCMNDTTTNARVAAAAAGDGLNLASAAGAAGCNEWVTTSILPATRVKFSVTSDEELCRFNYLGDKCDIGEINVNSYQVTYTPPGDDPVAQPAILKSEMVPRKVMCGGSVANCISGAITTLAPGKTRVTEITNSVINTPFTKEYSLPSVIGVEPSLKVYANYRRNLASTQIDYVSSDPDDLVSFPFYKTAFSDALYGKTFNTSVMDLYSNNKKLDTDPIVDSALITTYSFPGNRYKAVPLAADPYMGLLAKTSPFYTYYCFDTAFDIKARIRMVVREWDRVFPSTTDNEYISDIFRGANSRQDNPNYVELPDEYDSYIPFNDELDWDDSVPMERTAGPYDPTNTIWRPLPALGYPDGFFNPAYFTK